MAKNKQIILTGITLQDFIAEVNGSITKAVKDTVTKSVRSRPLGYDSGYLSREEAAMFLGVSLKTLREMTLSGEITGYKVKSRLRYKQNEIDLYMASKAVH